VPQTTRPIFSIGAVARMLELPPATIRTWEARYGLVIPQRTSGGQRLYTRRHVDQLRFLKESVAAGSRPGEAHRLLAERLGAEAAPKVRLALPQRQGLAAVLLRQLFERDGFVVAEDAQLVVVTVDGEAGVVLSEELKEAGLRVLALVEEGAADPTADIVLRLPIATHELVDAARRLAAG
jgi:DNA-binding transcriptional MerR regulator